MQHEIALLRLVAQRVAGPPLPDPAAAVRHLLAVQGQDLPGALTSVALRTAGRSRDEVRAALDAGTVVRTWPMRGTLHLVLAEDAAWMVELMTPRPRAQQERRRRELGLTDEHVARAQEVATTALTGGKALLRAEALALWEGVGIATSGGRGYHLLSHLAHVGVLCQGPMQGNDQAFVLLDEWVPAPRRPQRDEALAELALRYLRGHGPATVRDLARWSGLGVTDVRAGLAEVEDQLERLEVDDVTYYLDATTPALLDEHRAAARATHLLPGFDEMVLGYTDRTATVPAEHAERIVPGANGVFRPTVVHDGAAVATWRFGARTRDRTVEVEPFTELDPVLAGSIPALAAALP